MATREDVIAAINRVEKAGYAGEATRAAQLDLLLLPLPQNYDSILKRLQAAFPQVFPPAKPPPTNLPAEPPEQQGVAVRAMQHAESALAQQQSATADFDRQVIEAVLHAHKTTREGRALLDDLETQIECAARSWDLSTAAGAREFQRFLLTKLDQVISVVQEANDDDGSKRALAAAWAALYAAQGGPPDAAAATGDAPGPAATREQPELSGDDVGRHFDELPLADSQSFDEGTARRSAPATQAIPAIPAMPSFGGQTPGAGGLPAGAPGGLPLTGLARDPQRALSAAQLDDDPPVPDSDPMVAEDAAAEESAPHETGNGPTTVVLPDGETVTVATPQLAAVIQAAGSGTPIAEAFRQQGITIPPPGTPVTGPVDQSRVSTGDIGMFTDRHALAVGNSKALLDGQLQQIANVGGPSFLGWQHAPTVAATAAPAQNPAPTRLSATLHV